MIIRGRTLVAALFAVVFVSLPASAQHAQLTEAESRAIGTLRSCASAQATYFSKHKRFATISELIAGGFLDKSVGDGVKHSGYRFSDGEAGQDVFDIRAEPSTADAGRYSFNVIEDWLIRFERGSKAPHRAEGRVVEADSFE